MNELHLGELYYSRWLREEVQDNEYFGFFCNRCVLEHRSKHGDENDTGLEIESTFHFDKSRYCFGTGYPDSIVVNTSADRSLTTVSFFGEENI